MSKYVFCDLDFTLLDDNREVSKENLDAIKAFEAKGNHFIICSGRVPFALAPYKELLNSQDVITSNGALIISNNKVIKKVLLSKEQLLPMTDYAVKNNLSVRYFTSDLLILLNKDNGSMQSFIYKQHILVDNNTVYDTIKDKEIIKIAFISDDKKVLQDAEKFVNSLNIDVETTYSSNIFMEVNAIGQNKGNAILDYCKLNNIDIKDTIAIGDNDNDAPMLKAAGFSACPSNSIKEVKVIVDYVCKNDNNNHAVKEVLELF